MTTRTLRWAVGSILSALALFTILTLRHRSVAADEFSVVWAAQQPVHVITSLYLSPRENNPPGCALLLHGWGTMFGYSDPALRTFGLFWTLFSVWILWLLSNVLLQDFPRAINQTRLYSVVLAATTPIVWMSATIARYQSVTMALGLFGVYCYVRFVGDTPPNGAHNEKYPHRWIWWYVPTLAALFYIHYLPAAVLALSTGLHYVFTLGTRWSTHRSKVIHWAAAQAVVLLLIAPLVYWIVLAYTTIDLSAGQSNQLRAAPKFFAALLYGLVNGFVVPLWWLWAFVPSVAVFCLLLWKSVHRTILLSTIHLWIVCVPFGIASVVVAKMYPAETVFLYPVLQKISYLAPLFWLVVGAAVMRFQSERVQATLVAVMVACNCYAIAVWHLNLPAVQHTPPLREIAASVRQSSSAERSAVAHSFGYFYGPLGMGIAQGATTAVQHALPEAYSFFEPETDAAPAMSLDAAQQRVQECLRQGRTDVWIVQRNRYPRNAQMLAQALENAGFRLVTEQHLQEQSTFDVWFKRQLLQRGIGGANDPPQQFLYTLRHFQTSK
jgi:hypothetical protein